MDAVISPAHELLLAEYAKGICQLQLSISNKREGERVFVLEFLV